MAERVYRIDHPGFFVKQTMLPSIFRNFTLQINIFSVGYLQCMLIVNYQMLLLIQINCDVCLKKTDQKDYNFIIILFNIEKEPQVAIYCSNPSTECSNSSAKQIIKSTAIVSLRATYGTRKHDIIRVYKVQNICSRNCGKIICYSMHNLFSASYFTKCSNSTDFPPKNYNQTFSINNFRNC